ncbi:hypothetical protein DFH07DRAFT_948796 [Mycena maculata]|uniref:Uncharacterized protein n=1 Tax=Mycena maculata TaxID=230809 RepID=A0AAD7KE80_9AGAR|nr:hypothetical protein DFH07DRAFT_948796 [Mycena maculata]
MDFIQTLDPSKLILGLTALSFIISPFAAPPYNLPILLFGILAQQQENSDGQALHIFTGLLGVSVFFDIIWMVQNGQNSFIRVITVLLLLLKVPTFITFGLSLRQRGSRFTGLGGIRSSDLGGATVWDSMPGGFGSSGNGGYQNVDEERPAAQYLKPTPPPASTPVAQPAAQAPAAPGAYQTV